MCFFDHLTSKTSYSLPLSIDTEGKKRIKSNVFDVDFTKKK